MNDEIQKRLFELQDTEYRDFGAKIINNIPKERIIGVRSPALRKLAAEYRGKDVSAFLNELPHTYHEENYLHAQFINTMKNFGDCMRETERFLPYIDNWAICDTLAPKVFAKHRSELLGKIPLWHASGHTYTIRFGTGALMRWFLDEDFDTKYADMAAAVRSDEYYVNMMTAWYFATALAKQYDAVLPYIEQRKLDPWTHNKAIQKATESFRVSDEHKAYLRTLKV